MTVATWIMVVLLGTIEALLLIPAAMLTLQAVVSLRRSHSRDEEPDSEQASRSPSVVVLVPAHNEASGIHVTLRSLLAGQVGERTRVLVVADNCTDETAAVASREGAEVVERTDLKRRGKGFALDFGVRHLAADPCDIVVIIDADCVVGEGDLDVLIAACAKSGRPVQALYLMSAPPDAPLKQRVSEFAWRVKNQARPLALRRLNLPCQLMGTGMAFPWPLLAGAELASSHLVEDIKLGLELSAAGYPPRFCPRAKVTSSFPTEAVDAAAQRTRWEHGHLGLVVSEAPRLLWTAIVTRRGDLFMQVIDILVPPLVSLVLLQLCGIVLTGVFAVLTSLYLPLAMALAAIGLVTAATGLMWSRFGRDLIRAREIVSLPAYFFAKLPIYIKFLRSRQVEWIRTTRDEEHK